MSTVSSGRLAGDNLAFGDNGSTPATVVMMKATIVGGNQGKLTLSADSSYGSQVVLDGLNTPTNTNEAATKGYVDGLVPGVDDVTIHNNSSNQNKMEVKDGGIGAGKLAAAVAGDGLALSSTAMSVNVDGTTIEIDSDALRVKASSIATSHISDAAITSAKIHTGVAGNGLTGGGGTALAVQTDDTTVEIDSDQLRLKDGGVTESKLNASVAGPGLSGGAGQSLSVSVDSSSLELNGSGNVQVKGEGISASHIGAGAITSVKLASSLETAEFTATTSMTSPTFIATSDRRLKDCIEYTHPVDELHKVMHLRPATYVFKDNPEVKRQGVIAQDVASIAPHLVAELGTGSQKHMAVNYTDLTSSLIGAVQALQAQLNELRDHLVVT